jgi:hypothetical protein
MLKENKLLFLRETDVVDFLSRVENYFKNSKYIELFVALMLNKFCEKQFGCKCLIGLEIKSKYIDEVSNCTNVTFEKLDEILIIKTAQDTPVDITISKTPTKIGDIAESMHFQIKRFGGNKYKQDTQSLIEFLNNDCRKYGKSQTNLIVLIESPKEIDLQLLQKSINTDNYPFEKIMLTGLSENKYINYYGIWPESGWSRYNLDNFQFEF